MRQDDGKTRYGRPCDIWSIGVLAFHMRTREKFANEQVILRGGLDPSRNIQKVPEDDLKIFLHACLQLDPKTRKTATDLRMNTFLSN